MSRDNGALAVFNIYFTFYRSLRVTGLGWHIAVALIFVTGFSAANPLVWFCKGLILIDQGPVDCSRSVCPFDMLQKWWRMRPTRLILTRTPPKMPTWMEPSASELGGSLGVQSQAGRRQSTVLWNFMNLRNVRPRSPPDNQPWLQPAQSKYFWDTSQYLCHGKVPSMNLWVLEEGWTWKVRKAWLWESIWDLVTIAQIWSRYVSSEARLHTWSRDRRGVLRAWEKEAQEVCSEMTQRYWVAQRLCASLVLF